MWWLDVEYITSIVTLSGSFLLCTAHTANIFITVSRPLSTDRCFSGFDVFLWERIDSALNISQSILRAVCALKLCQYRAFCRLIIIVNEVTEIAELALMEPISQVWFSYRTEPTTRGVFAYLFNHTVGSQPLYGLWQTDLFHSASCVYHSTLAHYCVLSVLPDPTLCLPLSLFVRIIYFLFPRPFLAATWS